MFRVVVDSAYFMIQVIEKIFDFHHRLCQILFFFIDCKFGFVVVFNLFNKDLPFLFQFIGRVLINRAYFNYLLNSSRIVYLFVEVGLQIRPGGNHSKTLLGFLFFQFLVFFYKRNYFFLLINLGA